MSKRKKALTLRLDVETHEELRVYAEKVGLGLSTLIRTIVVEHIRNKKGL